jgi:GTPase SAR1 family protein
MRKVGKSKKAPAAAAAQEPPADDYGWTMVEKSRAPPPAPESHKMHTQYMDMMTESYHKRQSNEATPETVPTTFFMQKSRVGEFKFTMINQKAQLVLTGFRALPSEILRHMLSHMCTPDLRSFSATCTRFWVICRQLLDERMARFPIYNMIHLNSQQQRILRLAKLKRLNLCIQGAAGTGKSILLGAIYYHLVNELGLRVYILAPTGVAAMNVNGITIHEYFGFGTTLPDICGIEEIRRGGGVRVHRIRNTDVIIVDEMGMVSAQLFGVMKKSLEVIRDNYTPCGNVQMIFMGDLAQLSPVPNSEEKAAAQLAWGELHPSEQYCIEHPLWKTVFLGPEHENTVCLTQPMRQNSDVEFLELLNDLRGTEMPSQKSRALLESRLAERLAERQEAFGIALHIMPTRNQVRAYNDAQLEALKKRVGWTYHNTLVFPAIGVPNINTANLQLAVQLQLAHPEVFDFLKQREMLNKSPVHLREGARVILCKNFAAHRLCNGSMGVIRKLIDLTTESMELYHLLEGNKAKSQLLAKYPNIRRVQILSDNLTELGLNCPPVVGRPRPPPADGCRWTLCARQFAAAESTHDCSNAYSNGTGMLPLVLFDQHPGILFLVLPYTQQFYRPGPVQVLGEQPGAWQDAHGDWFVLRNRRVAAVVTMPLQLCYAATFHRVEGLTLDRISLSMGECWDPGQPYTGLSRVRRLKDICITSMPNLSRLYNDKQTLKKRAVNRFLDTVESKAQIVRKPKPAPAPTPPKRPPAPEAPDQKAKRLKLEEKDNDWEKLHLV